MDYREASHEYWNRIWNRIEDYTTDNWLDDFESIITPATGTILDLGCGDGNDTFYLLSRGKDVIACDQSEIALKNVRKHFRNIETMKFNMLDGIPFADNAFEIVIADLSLHYFTTEDTNNIIQEIKRVLKPEGHILLRVNSINDTNHGAGQGKEIEPHLYENNNMLKRFFDVADICVFFKEFAIEYINEELMHRYEKPKWVFKVSVKKP